MLSLFILECVCDEYQILFNRRTVPPLLTFHDALHEFLFTVPPLVTFLGICDGLFSLHSYSSTPLLLFMTSVMICLF